MSIYEYSVPDVTCSLCTNTIDNAIENIREQKKLHPAIRSVNIDLFFEPPRAFVDIEEEYEGELAKLALDFDSEKGIEKQAKEVVKTEINRLLEEECVIYPFTDVVPVEIEIRKHFIKGILSLICGSLILGLSISGLGLPMFAMWGLGFFSTALTLFLGKETYQGAYKKLKAKELTMHSLFSISTFIALSVSIASFFFRSIPMMFDAALLIFGFVHIGEAYKKSTKQNVQRAHSYRA